VTSKLSKHEPRRDKTLFRTKNASSQRAFDPRKSRTVYRKEQSSLDRIEIGQHLERFLHHDTY